MPKQAKPAGQAAALQEVADTVEAIDQVMHQLADVKNSEWRPRRHATILRRLERFEDEMKRQSIKPPAA